MRYPLYKCACCVRSEVYRRMGVDTSELLRGLPSKNSELTTQFFESILENGLTEEGLRMDAEMHCGHLYAFHTMYTEYLYFKRGFRVVYVEPEVIEMTMRAKLDIDFDRLINTAERIDTAFSFAFPENAVWKGVYIRPILVTAVRGVDFQRDINRLVRQKHNIGIGFTPEGDVAFDELRNVLGMFTRNADGHLFARAACQEHMEKYIRGEEVIPDSGARPQGLSDAEAAVIAIYSRLVYGLLTYIAAFQDAMHEGFPEGMKERDQRHARNETKHRTSVLRLPVKFRNSPIPHFRHGHFRTLRHERYKRMPDGSAQIIYVNDMLVNKHTVKADTLEVVTR